MISAWPLRCGVLVDGDTWLEIAGDYHINQKFAAGVSIEFGGDTDVFTIGGRFFFR